MIRSSRSTGLRRAAAVAAGAVLVAVGLAPPGASRAATGSLDLQSLSTRAELVTGGQVLARVSGLDPDGTDELRVTRNGEDVTGAFSPDADGTSATGLVDGLTAGSNVLAASVGPRTDRLTVTNHSADGPIISGPHEQPYYCSTATWRLVDGSHLGAPTDENCNAPTKVVYAYRTTAGATKPLPDLQSRPDDLATTTTIEGVTVPFIIRVETGTVNRAVYEVAMLHDPGTPAPTRTTPSEGWNDRLIFTFGGGCRSGWYIQGNGTGGVLDPEMLRRGYAVASSSLNVFGNNCNDLLASETAIMVKERFVEQFGSPRFTIGWGCSGGSYQSHQIADNYPGVLDGIVVGCSFPDVTSATIFTLLDARVLHTYFTTTAPGLFTTEQQRAVSGFGVANSIPNLSAGAKRLDPDAEFSSAVPSSARYDAATNPGGARATVFDHTVNVYGRDPVTGFAQWPLDNVGVQYGLAALKDGAITGDQFVDLNSRVGGVDRDANPTTTRTVADARASIAAYGTGRILNGGGGLATTPVIDHRSYTDDLRGGDIHMNVHGFTTRARLIAANGDADNHVMLEEDNRHGFSLRSPQLREALTAMDQWLTTLTAKDGRTHASVVAAKPAGLTDACWTRDATPRKITQELTFANTGECGRIYPSYPTPRLVAGAPLTDDVVKCQLKEVDPADYAGRLTPEQVDRLREAFPQGVCDWSKAGIWQRGLAGTWQSVG